MLMDYTVLADVSAHVAALFVRFPMLTGFSVQDSAIVTRERGAAPLAEDLCVADVAVDAWPGLQAGPAVRDEIVATLLDLLDKHPDSREVLRGHTFARTFH